MNDWLSHRARATPDATALVVAESGDEWEYDALDAAVSETAGRLSALGVEPSDHLGMLLPTSVDAVCVVHAAMRLGATLVPLNVRLTAAELGERVDAADVTALVCGTETEQTAVEAAEDVPLASVDDPQWEDVVALDSVSVSGVERYSWDRNEALVLLSTSGTTGTPKVVTLTLENVLSSAVASAFRLGVLPDDRWLVPLALYHMGGLAPLYRSALYGTTVVLRGDFEPGQTADDISTHDVTCVSLVPTMLQRMLDSRGTLADSLRFVLLGGAPAPKRLVERCRDFHVPVCPTYGMTETASQVATATPEEAFEHLGTVGKPLLWTDVTVVDDDGEPVEAGGTVDGESEADDSTDGERVVGEFVVSGPTVSPGYYENPEANESAYTDRGLRTGDVGYRDDVGRLYVLNRRDDRIITGGENVDPGEVVDALLTHPGVKAAAVVGIPDEEWGEQVAAAVVASDPDLTTAALDEHCRDRLAGFKIPRTVEFVDELPRTASGTVEREAIRRQLLEDVVVEDAESGDNAAMPDDSDTAEDGGEDEQRSDDGFVDSDPVDPESETEAVGPGESGTVGSDEPVEGDEPVVREGDPDAESDGDAERGDPGDDAGGETESRDDRDADAATDP